MATLTNKGKLTPIGFPGGAHLKPGETGEVSNWAELKGRKVYQFYVKEGVLVVAADDQGQGDERHELFTKLKALGVDAAGNSKTETLRKKLEEAEAAKAAADAEAVEKHELFTKLKALGVEFDEAASLDELRAILAVAKA